MTVQAAATSVWVLGQHHGDVAASKHPLDGCGGDYLSLVRSSFARYLADWLLDAVAEYAPGEP